MISPVTEIFCYKRNHPLWMLILSSKRTQGHATLVVNQADQNLKLHALTSQQNRFIAENECSGGHFGRRTGLKLKFMSDSYTCYLYTYI